MRSKIHVLQLGPYPPPRGGVQTNMLAIEDELLAGGYRSSIISITKSENPNCKEGVYHPRGSFALFKLITSLKYDLLHLHIGGALPLRVVLLILVCGFFSRGKSILTFHSGGYAASEEGANANFLTLRGFAFRRYDKIIVVNQSMIEMFERFGVKRQKIHLIYPFALSKPNPAIEVPEVFKRFFERHSKVLITVGLLETDYDLPQQINFLERILEKEPKSGLVIIGSGSLETDLRNLIESKTYKDHILLAGDTNREVVLHLIEKADLMLRTTIFDGDAISVRESLFLGTPVIATDNNMRPDGVKLIPVGDIDALERAVEQEFQRDKKSVQANDDGMDNIRNVIGLYKNVVNGTGRA